MNARNETPAGPSLPQPRSLFLSGPFTGVSNHVRTALVWSMHRRRIEPLQKHGEIRESSSELIGRADGLVLVLGTQNAAIRDAWGRSLIHSEVEFATTQAKPVGALLLHGDRAELSDDLRTLRELVTVELGARAFTIRAVTDGPATLRGELAWRLGLGLASCRIDNRGWHLPQDLAPIVRQHFGPEVLGLLEHDATAAAALDAIRGAGNSFSPTLTQVTALLSEVDAFVDSWPQRAAPFRNPRVFISYSREDQGITRLVFDALKAAGLEPWIDERRIAGGQEFWTTILSAMQTCGTVVVLVSDRSSRSTWVRREVSAALAMRKRLGIDRFVLPIALDDTRPGAIEALAGLHHLRLRSAPADFAADITEMERMLRTPRTVGTH